MSLQGKTLFITGGSRGIGLAIALKAAADRQKKRYNFRNVSESPDDKSILVYCNASLER